MTDPQTAADAAERVQAYLDARRAIGDTRKTIASVEPDPCAIPARIVRLIEADVRALLEDRKRMAAELEQVRGERDALQHLYDGREDDEPHACNGGGIMPCSICGEYTPDVEAQKCFQAAVAADMERARQTGVLAEIEAWENAETIATRPAGGSDAEGAGKGPESHGDATDGAPR